MPDQQARLRSFFSPESWESSFHLFPKSGEALVPAILALEPRFVVDVGCGYNEFKERIPNLIGIDLVNPAADLVCDLESAPFKEGSMDVILALGSINFGDRATIARQLQVLRSWLADGGTLFMRGNPGEAIHDDIELFAWSEAEVRRFADELRLEIVRPVEEEELVKGDVKLHRLCWAYRKT